MLIAQISDLHLGFVPDDPDEMNARRLDALLDHMLAGPVLPDLLIATGDLVERGDEASYARLRAMLDRCPFPVHYALGNHDLRDGFAAVFGDTPCVDGYYQYAIDLPALRVLVLDTLEDGRHGGGFCPTRAAWLATTLAEQPDAPTLIALHHPPFPTGVSWMTTDPREPWVARLGAAMAGHDNIVGLVCGHIHRPIVSRFAGVPVAVCPPSAPAVALTLLPIDPEVPDNRPMIVDTVPAYALHLWDGAHFVTHFVRVEPEPVIVAYEPYMQPLLRKQAAERPAGI